MADQTEALRERIVTAHDRATPLAIRGGGSKAFYGRPVQGETLATGNHTGVISYDPSELVITARSGTPLLEIENTLEAAGQMLPFEPPHFAAGATVGGAVACGLSGPRRPFAGAVRDFVLGTRAINGRGEVLRFGGEVIKNVAGYDLARTMTGALGSLGLLLEVSLKVLPKPQREITLSWATTAEEALERMQQFSRRPLPLSAACHHADTLYLRLSGTEKAVQSARERLGGELLDSGDALWRGLRDHSHPFFYGTEPLWRLSVRPDAPHNAVPGDWYIDWGGAQRWLRSASPTAEIRAFAARCGGHATLFRSTDRNDVFQPPTPALLALQRRLKQAFDPKNILNPGRLYPEL